MSRTAHVAIASVLPNTRSSSYLLENNADGVSTGMVCISDMRLVKTTYVVRRRLLHDVSGHSQPQAGSCNPWCGCRCDDSQAFGRTGTDANDHQGNSLNRGADPCGRPG